MNDLEERKPGPAGVEVESSYNIAEIQGQIVMAKKFPRDIVRARDRILVECQRLGVAQGAQYAYPKGGKMVTGASIRLAEVLARNWGNMSYGITEIDRSQKESTMMAYAWDLETNVMSRQVFVVRHIIDKRDGGRDTSDEREVYELTANNGARRMRACILRIIPEDIVTEAESQCAKTIKAKIGDIAKRIPGLLSSFQEFGVSKIQIEKRIMHRIEALTDAEFMGLTAIYTSLRDGMSVPLDYFEAVEAEKQAEPEKPKSGLEAAAEAAGVESTAESGKIDPGPSAPQPQANPSDAAKAETVQAKRETPEEKAKREKEALLGRIANVKKGASDREAQAEPVKPEIGETKGELDIF